MAKKEDHACGSCAHYNSEGLKKLGVDVGDFDFGFEFGFGTRGDF